MRSTLALLLISDVIATLGVAALTLYVFGRRDRERFLPEHTVLGEGRRIRASTARQAT